MKVKRFICLLLVLVLLPIPTQTVFAEDDVVTDNFSMVWFNDDPTDDEYNDE